MQEIKVDRTEVDLKTTYVQIQPYGSSSKLNYIIGLQMCNIWIYDNINSMISEEEEEEEEEEEDDDDVMTKQLKQITVDYMNFPWKYFFLIDTSNHTGNFM